MRRNVKLFGTGFRFPLVFDRGFDWIESEDAVAQSLRQLLLTRPGERIGRPNYGVGLRQFLYAQNTLSTRSSIRQIVIDAIERHEPRVKLDEVEVLSDAERPGLLHIDIAYRLINESTPRNLVFPFYLDQGQV